MNVLFLCTGNTCRSPMAEVIARKLFADHGIDAVCRSAGLRVFSPLPLSREAEEALKERGLEVGEHVSRPVTAELLDWADRIIPVTEHHAAYLKSTFPCHCPVIPLPESVGDPYGGNLSVYRKTADALEKGILCLIEKGAFRDSPSSSHS